jgi:hypothetical protein
MTLIDSKSILAKLMATEDLIVEQRNVATAFFDVKNRILTVPILDKDISPQLYDLFMGHEVGHALYTPLDGLMKSKEEKMNMGILNIVEDSRIERKIKYKYPGLKNSFVKAYQELLEKDFFATEGKDLNEYNFIDRVNLHCKGGAGLAIKFNETERDLLKDIESTETFDQVIEVTKRVIDYMKMIEEEKQKYDDPGEGNELGEDEGDNESDQPNYDEDEEGNSNQYSDEPSEDDVEEPKEKDSSNKTGTGQQDDSEKNIRSLTDEAYRKNEHQLFSNDDTQINYVNIPEFDVNQIFDYKDVYKKYREDNYDIDKKGFDKFRRESNKVVSYLVKEFEMRKNADQLKRASTSKTGDLNLNRIFSYQFNEDIFKKVTVVPGGKSHGLIIFLDWSGSMAQHIGNTVKQLLNLVMFCKKVNIPFEVYSFIEETVGEEMVNFKVKPNDISTYSFGIINLLSSRMSSKDFVYAGAALMHIAGVNTYRNIVRTPYWMSLSGTPLNEIIIAAMEIVPHFQKKNKLQIVNTVFLTDGDGHPLTNVYTDYTGYTRDLRKGSNGKEANKIIIRDPKTKNEEQYDTKRYNNFQTTCLIKLLKARTNSNVIGFYIAHGRDYRSKVDQFFGNNKEYEAIKEAARKDRYCIVNNAGFNEYYLLRSEAMNTDENNELIVKENATTRGIVSAFNKYASGRVNNRVVLNRFIDLIT